MDVDKDMYVTTDGDYWNSADGSGFFVIKGQVKKLPEVTTPIMEDALAQGLLREATVEEMKKYEYSVKVEKAVQERKIKAGKKYEETVKNYEEYLAKQKEKEEKEKEPETEEIILKEPEPKSEPVKEKKVEKVKDEKPDEDHEEAEDEEEVKDEEEEPEDKKDED